MEENKSNEIIDALTDDTKTDPPQTSLDNEVPASPYSGIKRALTEDDLNNPAIKKLILSENDRLESRICKLEKIETNFHHIDKEKAVLEVKLLKNNSFEILYSSCLTIGSALAGISGIFWEKKGFILMIIGIVLIAGGIFAKIFKK